MVRRGINGPRRGFEEILTNKKNRPSCVGTFIGAMPPALRPLWRKLLLDPWKNDPSQNGRPIANALKPELLQLIPDDRQHLTAYFLAGLVLVPAPGVGIPHGMRTCLRSSSWTISLLY